MYACSLIEEKAVTLTGHQNMYVWANILEPF